MQAKEILALAGGAILLINLSIVATLYASGYLTHQQQPSTTEETSSASTAAVTLDSATASIPALHSTAQAMYVCEDQLNSSDIHHQLSYQINSVASRFLETEGVYRIFFETQSISRADAPMQTAEVMCEVSARSQEVERFRTWVNHTYAGEQ